MLIEYFYFISQFLYYIRCASLPYIIEHVDSNNNRNLVPILTIILRSEHCLHIFVRGQQDLCRGFDVTGQQQRRLR